ncbi:hypothetical protein LIER_15660 [Lithospermum erythrorhizon]|uniref:Uncharacterized protein n=1 Tax=Lithospermum erythrorhizon TaxID=34254 RepID=A0AAV3Q4Q9_LITER
MDLGFKKSSLLNPRNRPISDSPILVEVEKVKEKPEERLGCKAGIFLKLNESEMSMRTSYEVMGEGVGGTENLGFRFPDLKNYLMTIRQKEMVVDEATVVQEFFRNEALLKPSFL